MRYVRRDQATLVMTTRLTSAQVAALQPGDRVSRIVRPGEVQTAPVVRLTELQLVVTWPDGSTARYWRESGQRTDCRGEVLREAEPASEAMPERSDPVTGDPWLDALGPALSSEADRFDLTESERSALYGEIHYECTTLGDLFSQCYQAKFPPRDTATLLVDAVVQRRMPALVTPDWARVLVE